MTTRCFCLILLFFTSSAAASMCVCAPPKWAFKEADAVFIGEVVEPVGDLSVLRVVEAFRGVEVGQLAFMVPRHRFGFWFGDRGVRYLVYASRGDDGSFYASTCGRTRQASDVECEVRLVRKRAKWWAARISDVGLLRALGVWNCSYCGS